MEVPGYSNESFQTGNRTKSSQDTQLTLSPRSCFKQEHHTFIYKYLPFIFLLSSKTRSDILCTCKNSYWLYFVGSVDYTCFFCHVSYHLLNTQGSASGILTVPGNTNTAKGPIFSPGATGASGTVPALISAHIGHVLFTLSKCSQTFNLPKDCPLVFPQRRGIKLVIIKKEKTLLSSFSSLSCEEHAQLKWFQQRQIPWAFSTKTKEWTGGNSPGSRSLNGARHDGVSQYSFPLYVVI